MIKVITEADQVDHRSLPLFAAKSCVFCNLIKLITLIKQIDPSPQRTRLQDDTRAFPADVVEWHALRPLGRSRHRVSFVPAGTRTRSLCVPRIPSQKRGRKANAFDRFTKCEVVWKCAYRDPRAPEEGNAAIPGCG
jgi:hypothetical protein